MPTILELATELGIDPATLKPEAVTKWNKHLADADTQYASAAQLKKDAEANLASVQAEKSEIDAYIRQYGESTQTIAALQANNASMEASLKALKDAGMNVTIPTAPAIPAKKADVFDPEQFAGRMGSLMAQSVDASNKYMALYGKPLPDGLETLAREATQARKEVGQYAAEKYDFAGEEKRKSEAAQKTRDAEIAAKAVADYKEKNPVVEGNPFQRPGVDSRYSQVFKPREAADLRKFGNMSARDKVASSVARVREALTANQ